MPNQQQTNRSLPLQETKHFKILPKQIGKGAYSQVYLAQDTNTNEEVVAKRMNLCQLNETFRHEVEVMNGLNHPNIVKFLGYLTRGTSGYIFMERIHGENLFNYVQKYGDGFGITEGVALEILYDVLIALDYMHQNCVGHHDLKSENIVYDSHNRTAKIIDFGMSVNFSDNSLVESNSGSPLYSAPEVLFSLPHDPTKSDIWSIGIMLYYMLVGDYPWPNVNSVDDLLTLFSTQTISISYPDHVSSQMQEIVNKILVFDPAKRMCLSEVIKVIEYLKSPSVAS